jgi:hypothetical protein
VVSVVDGDGGQQGKWRRRQQGDYSADALTAGGGDEGARSSGEGDVDDSPADLIDDPNDVAWVDAAFFRFKTDARAQVAVQRRGNPGVPSE